MACDGVNKATSIKIPPSDYTHPMYNKIMIRISTSPNPPLG
jgi:hypothetical protein